MFDSLVQYGEMADICAPIRRPSVSYRIFADRPAGVSAVAVDYKP